MEFIDHKPDQAETARLETVLKLISGIESPYGLELLATVDFLINETGQTDSQASMNAINHWSARKNAMFPIEHVRLAVEHLRILQN